MCVSSRDIRDFARILRKGCVMKEGCRVLSNTPRVAGGAASKLYHEKKNLKDKYMKRKSEEFSMPKARAEQHRREENIMHGSLSV